MDSVSSSEFDGLAHESVRREIEFLRAKLYDQVVVHVKNQFGWIKGLGGLQQYMDFKVCLENLPGSRRPKESTWPPIFLDAFEPESAYLSALSKPKRVEYIRNEFDRMDKHLLESGYEFRSLDGDSECAEDCSDLEEYPSSNGQSPCVEEEICGSRDLVVSDLATEDSVVTCSLDHPNNCNPGTFCEMDSVCGSVSDLPSYEDVYSEIQTLKQLLHNELVIRIRHEVGNIKYLDDIRVFLKFWKALTSFMIL